MEILRLHLRNFLSYREATLELGRLTALVGPNAAGKSNAVTAIRLLREIPTYGLQTALARRGGFDQLRHRSEGRPYDPSIELDFRLSQKVMDSKYELHLGAVKGKRYEVKLEQAHVATSRESLEFQHRKGRVQSYRLGKSQEPLEIHDPLEIPTGQSALPVITGFGGYPLWSLLTSLQTVEINPARVRELQNPTPLDEFQPDGSNTASFFETLTSSSRQELVDQLSAIVPGIERIEPRHLGDKLTLLFFQRVSGRTREFTTKQMSDGTLRAFGILLSFFQPKRPTVVVIEEPETAIHLGALKTLVELLRDYALSSQILITTHSADIVDSLELEDLRVVWSEEGASRISPVAKHTKIPVKQGLVTPGELLRSDALDPAYP